MAAEEEVELWRVAEEDDHATKEGCWWAVVGSEMKGELGERRMGQEAHRTCPTSSAAESKVPPCRGETDPPSTPTSVAPPQAQKRAACSA